MPKRINSIEPREEYRRRHSHRESAKGWYISQFIVLFVMVLLIFLAVNIRIYYNQKAEMLNRETARVQRQIHELDREIENLKKRKEQMSSFENISKKNNTYRLGLRQASPLQIRRTALIRRSKNSGGYTISSTVSAKPYNTAYVGRGK